MSTVIEMVSKRPIPPHLKNITLEIMAENRDEEDVEVRYSIQVLAHKQGLNVCILHRFRLSCSAFDEPCRQIISPSRSVAISQSNQSKAIKCSLVSARVVP